MHARWRRLAARATLASGLLAGAASAAPQAACQDLPALPSAPPPQGVLKVTDFGADGRDEVDDTAAIQRAIDALQPGQWLVFPPGRYLHATALTVRQRGVTLWGAGATLHATQPQSQAMVLAEDGISLLHFTLTAVTGQRGSMPQQARIAVWRRDPPNQPVRGVTIRENRIVPAGQPGPDLANSASSAGIFLYRAVDFLVAGNRIERTLADGIHITAGSHDGRVLRNTVRETGDDMIGLVSYLGDGPFTRNTAAELAGTLARRTEDKLVHDVLVADNDLGGAYWGRGIAVVGGRGITLLRNHVAETTRAAAIYLAREANYVTFGVRNVRVQDNVIDQVQTTQPRDSGGRTLPDRRTGHAAIQLHADLFEDEHDQPELADVLGLEDIAIVGNRVNGAASGGLRINEARSRPGLAGPLLRGQRADGTAVERRLVRATVRGVSVQSNQFQAVQGATLAWPDDADEQPVRCTGNRLEGRAIDSSMRCAAPAGPPRTVPGAALQGCVMP